MIIVSQCNYTKLALQKLIPLEQKEFVHAVIHSWQQVPLIVLELRNYNSLPVYLYLPSHMVNYMDVFYLLIKKLKGCRLISHFYDIKSPDYSLYDAYHPKTISLSKNDYKYLTLISKGCFQGVICRTTDSTPKKIYNQRDTIIRKLNLPNHNILIILSGVVLSLGNHILIPDKPASGAKK